MNPKALGKPRALFLAGHPALDFLNTRMSVNENVVDILQSDEDVLIWLKQAGFPAQINGKTGSAALLRSARSLRESVRTLIEKRKSGKRGDPCVLNRFLAVCWSHPQLVWKKSNTLTIQTVRRQETAESILAPVAEAAANLLTTADFDLIKHCEGDACLMWFFDQTKSHNRRWCSMEMCGNRHKVAAYRVRGRKASTR